MTPHWTEEWTRPLPAPAGERSSVGAVDADVPLAVAGGFQGRFAIVPPASIRVHVLGRDGRPEPDWGPGDETVPGPAAAARWTRDGRLLVLYDDPSGAAVIVHLRDGRPSGTATAVRVPAGTRASPPGRPASFAVGPDGTVYLAERAAAGGGDALLLRIPLGSERVDTLLSVPGLPAWSVGRDGEIVAGSRSGAYRIVVIGMARSLSRLICREAPAHAVRRLFAGGEGRIWVERRSVSSSTASPTPSGPSVSSRLDERYGRPGARFDVFGPRGRYLGQLEAPAGSRLVAASGRTVWGLRATESGEVALVAYQLDVTRG